VAAPQQVGSAGDPALAEYRALRDVTLRKSLEAEHGLFIAEGEKVIRRAFAAGYVVRSMLMSPRWVESLADVVETTNAPVYVADEALLESVTGFHVHRGALAAFQRRALPSVESVLAGARRVLVLEDVNDHTNVGAIFRNAAAFGMDAVLISPRCADPLYRRSIKVAMGAVFSVPWTRIDDWNSGPDLLRDAGFQVLALTPAADAMDIGAAVLGERVALLLGSEGHGLSSRWMKAADERVHIPMSGAVDSLNVAVASAIACFILDIVPIPTYPHRTLASSTEAGGA
jgi:tRNA G18 (ribose-2'-O)-methylase SpoU